MHKRPYTMEEVDSDEEKLIEVRKHIIGLIIFYVQVLVGAVLAAGLLYVLLPSVLGNSDQILLIANVFLLLALVVTFAVVTITTFVYNQNRIIVTDRNITQVLQFGLFSRKVSQLNITNIEDVTSVQRGFLPTLLNFGVLKIETAGEQSNFHFSYCPNSNFVAKTILDARERMLGQTDGYTVAGGGKPKISATRKSKTDSENSSDQSNKKISSYDHTKHIPNEHVQAIKGLGAEVVEHATREK